MFLVAGTILVVLLAGALAVDLSIVATRGQDLQNAADSAALAGVQAYRQSIGEGNVADDDDVAAAEAAVAAILAQNGIKDIVPVVTFPDSDFNTEVTVTLVDEDSGTLIGGITGGKSSVSRYATARFERCDDGCVKTVEIPEPFRGVNARGDGDGYKPIPVGDRLYSINHNSGQLGNAGGNQQITCVDRVTQEGCWGPEGARYVNKNAYPSGYVPDATPEMPHAAVVGDTIYWASTTQSAHYMYCWETVTDTPCSTPLALNFNSRVSFCRDGCQVNDARLQHRGGGTVGFGNRVYTFTDDHRVHCVTATNPMAKCSGYGTNGVASGLGVAGFDPNDPNLGQHGSSIDRIIDDSGKIYSTLHIDSHGQCGNNFSSNLQRWELSGIITFKNSVSDQFVAINTVQDGPDAPYTKLVDYSDQYDTSAHWRVVYRNGQAFRVKSVGAEEVGLDRYLTFGPNLEDEMTVEDSTSSWNLLWLEHEGTTSEVESYNSTGGYQVYSHMKEAADPADTNPNDGIDVIIVGGGETDINSAGVTVNAAMDWVITHPPCNVGTYIHCFDAAAGEPCEGFEISRLHVGWDSFDGRLFFHYSAGDPDSATPALRPQIQGVCSTGFTSEWEYNLNMGSSTEIACVHPASGVEMPGLEDGMATFRNALASANDAAGNWGTWGDPHYNEATNRLFYPTHRRSSQVLCWDFDDGWCNQVTGGSDFALAQGFSQTQDYGFYSIDKCVFGLGHNAIFWAFQADDLGEPCTGSSRSTVITPCNCGGELYWGSITFDVDTDAFETFEIEIFNQAGVREWPRDPLDPPHSLHDDGATINLSQVPILGPTDQLTVEVTVDADGNPWAFGGQNFTIELARAPQLTE